MAVPCRKQLGRLLLWLWVSLCCVAILHETHLDEKYYTHATAPSDTEELQHRRLNSDPTSAQTHAATGRSGKILLLSNTRRGSSGTALERRRHLIQRRNDNSSSYKTGSNVQVDQIFQKRFGKKYVSKLKDKHMSSGKESQPQIKLGGLRMGPRYFNEMSDEGVDRLTAILKAKLDKVSSSDTITVTPDTCNTSTIIGNSCDRTGCLQLQLPHTLRTRVEQIVWPIQLRVSREDKAILASMAADIPGYSEVLLVTGASNNHYLESQAMLRNLHENLLPHLKNFTFLFYDLGLHPEQRQHIASICRCVMMDFPFHLFPEFVSWLKCYTWKPLIVNAAIQRADLVFWLDASIRFHADPAHALSLLDRARRRGVQMGWSRTSIPRTTLPGMFHFFGDEACSYVPFDQGLSGVVIYHHEWMVKRAVLEPWAACALSGRCMCPQSGVDVVQARISCHRDKGRHYYGVCHRFDQSALSILVSKLYQDKVGHVILKDISDYVDIKRGDARPYETLSTE